LLAAGGGIVALMSYFSSEDSALKDDDQSDSPGKPNNPSEPMDQGDTQPAALALTVTVGGSMLVAPGGATKISFTVKSKAGHPVDGATITLQGERGKFDDSMGQTNQRGQWVVKWAIDNSARSGAKYYFLAKVSKPDYETATKEFTIEIK
jgi:hypothetical protein